MKILNELPPIWDQIVAGGLSPDTSNVIFTYGDTIYNPGAQPIPDYLIHHEETHSIQQGANPDAWWERYMEDHLFRIDQEADAYGRQYKFLCQKIKDRNQRHRLLYDIARSLSGPTYGNVITHADAMTMIRQRSGVSK